MVIMIAGASHTGKTNLAQKLLETYHYPYLSIDHLKMGLIRSGNTDLTPVDDEALVGYLWPIVREMIKTAIENHQNLIVEGCYIPFDWEKDFPEAYRAQIRYLCLIFSKDYITHHFDAVVANGSVIEKRLDDTGLSKTELICDNEKNLRECESRGLPYVLIHDAYDVKMLLEHLS